MREGWKESEIGFIPSEWRVQSIGETFKFSSGKSRPKNTSKEKTDLLNIPVYGGNGVLGYTDQIFTTQRHLILGRVGEYCGCVHLTNDSSWISDNALYGKEKFTNDDLFFLKYCFEFMDLNRYSNKMGQPLVTQGIINKIKFPVPPLPEQRKIAYVLSTIQKAIEQQDKLIKTTTELKKALMQKLFTEGTKGERQKQTEIGLVPESWEVQRFENTGEVVYGIQAAVASNLKPIGHKIITNKNITLEGKFDLEKINYFVLTSKRHFETILKRGDLLFNWRSGSKGHVGKTAIFDLQDGEYVHSSFILRIRVNKNHNAKFLFYYLNYLREVGYYQKVQTFSINAKFNKSAINAMPIALPNKQVQHEIAETISIIDKKIDGNIRTKHLLQTLFKTLLHELMTGQRRVNELNFEAMQKEYKVERVPLSMVAEN